MNRYSPFFFDMTFTYLPVIFSGQQKIFIKLKISVHVHKMLYVPKKLTNYIYKHINTSKCHSDVFHGQTLFKLYSVFLYSAKKRNRIEFLFLYQSRV